MATGNPIFSRPRRPKSGWWWDGKRVSPREFMALAAKDLRQCGYEIPEQDYIIMVEKQPGPFGNYRANSAWRREQWRKMRDWLRQRGADDVW